MVESCDIKISRWFVITFCIYLQRIELESKKFIEEQVKGISRWLYPDGSSEEVAFTCKEMNFILSSLQNTCKSKVVGPSFQTTWTNVVHVVYL